MKKLNLFNRSGMSPEVTCRKGRNSLDSIVSRFSLVSLICVLMLTLGVGNAWADYINLTSSTLGISGTGYSSNSTGKTISSVTFKWNLIQESSSGVLGFKADASSGLWNSSAMSYNIDSVVLTEVSYSGSSPSKIQVYGSTTAQGTTTKLYEAAGTGKIKVDFTSYSYKFFYIKRAAASRVAKTTSIKVYYTAASCAADVAIGTASLNGTFL